MQLLSDKDYEYLRVRKLKVEEIISQFEVFKANIGFLYPSVTTLKPSTAQMFVELLETDEIYLLALFLNGMNLHVHTNVPGSPKWRELMRIFIALCWWKRAFELHANLTALSIPFTVKEITQINLWMASCRQEFTESL